MKSISNKKIDGDFFNPGSSKAETASIVIEKSKVSIRNIRREANEELKKKLKDKIISEDQNKNFEKNIQKLTDTNIENIEKILNGKEKEIIQI